MAPTETRVRRALPWALGLIGLGSVLLELVVYRLDAAVYGWGFARLAAVVAPALGGLAAAWFASRSSVDDHAEGTLGTAAHASGLAAAACGIGAIALTWGSQRFAKLDGSVAAVAVPLLAWSVLAAALGTATAALFRFDPSRVGRHAFALAVGGAVGALLVPAALALGCPRALLLTGFVFGAASWLCVRSTRAPVRRAVLLTIPLALSSLSLGDIRNPWLKVRTDVARKGRVGAVSWSDAGLFQVDSGKVGIINYTSDRGPLRPLSLADKGKRRQTFELPDIAYFLNGTNGAALVVGAGGAREVREALDAGHARVDTIELSGALSRYIATELAAESGELLNPSERVTVRFGDPRAALVRLRDTYERIVVVGDPPIEPVASRFVAGGERLLTVEAIRAYLAHLAEPRGVLVLRAPKSHLPDLLATVAAASDADTVAERSVACAERRDDGAVALLVMAGPPAGPEIQNVEKSCKRKGLSIEFPAPEAKNGDRDREAKREAHEAKVAAFAGGHVVRDVRPFVEPTLGFGELRRRAVDAWRGLPGREAPKAKSKDDKDPIVPLPEVTALGVAASGALVAFAALLVAMLLRVRSNAGKSSVPASLRVATAFVGSATGLAVIGLDDTVVTWLGGVDWAWPVVVPTALVAFGAGKLFADAVGTTSLRCALVVGGLAAVVASGALGFLGADAWNVSVWPLGARLGISFVALFVVGAALGSPAALLVRLAARSSMEGVGFTAGAFGAASAFGTALAPLVARYGGLGRISGVAAVLFGVGVLVATLGGVARPSSAAPAE